MIFLKIGGFYDLRIVGGGDYFNAAAFIRRPLSEEDLQPAFKDSYTSYTENIQETPLVVNIAGNGKTTIGGDFSVHTLSYISSISICIAYHMWHGSRRNRLYKNRYALVEDIGDIRDAILINSDGLYEIKDPELQEKIMQFFVERDDDGVELIYGQ
jgi:hypothetical protein